MKKDKRIGKKFEITWIDANSESGWWDDENIRERLKSFIPQTTVGYFVMVYKGWIVFAMTDMHDDRYKKWGFWKAIPIRQVIKMRELK